MTEPRHQDEQDGIREEAVDSASAMLVKAREALGLSQKEVADQLRLTATFIRYIDDGDFHKIPKAAFIKGYLRSYARVVSLESDDVIRAYERDQQVTPPPEDIGGVAERAAASGNFSGPVVQTGIVGLVVVLIVVALVWSFSTGNEDTPPVVTQPVLPESTAPPVMPEAQAPVEPVAQDDVDSASVMPPDSGAAELQVADETVAPAPVPVESGPEAVPVEERNDVQIERVRDGDTLYITVRAGGQDEMGFVFSDECWLEIEDAGGKQIYGDLNRAGDVMSVYGAAPFVVLFGRASVATMTYQGKPVNLGPYTTGDETARVRTARL